MQAAADAGQHVSQETERLRAVGGHRAKWRAFFRRGDKLPAVVLADLQFIVFRRETIELVAVWQLTGKCREVVFSAIASISLEPGEDFAYGLDLTC